MPPSMMIWADLKNTYPAVLLILTYRVRVVKYVFGVGVFTGFGRPFVKTASASALKDFFNVNLVNFEFR